MNESSFRVCRVCLKTETETLLCSLLQGNGKKAEMFEEISGIDISQYRKYSIMICKNKCLKELEAAFILRSQMRHVENSYFQLRKDELEEIQIEEDQTRHEQIFKLETIEEPTIRVQSYDDPLLEEVSNFSESSQEENSSDEDFTESKKRSNSKHRPENDNRNRDFTCEICQKGFFTKYILEKHLVRHLQNPQSVVKNIVFNTSDSSRPFKCDECEMFFKNVASLKQHQFIHKNIKPFVCECGKSFRRNDHLKQHRLIHKKKKETS